jgi:hypothetical protein
MRVILVGAAAAAVSLCATAQNVVFTNSQNAATGQPYAIPLSADSAVTISMSGDLRAQCILEANGRCAGFPAGVVPSGSAPSVTLTTVTADADASMPGFQVISGSSFVLNASVTSMPDVCARSSSPSIPAWNGFFVPALVNGSVTLPAPGPYSLQVRCWNSTGVGEATFAAIATSSGQVPPAEQPTGEPSACTAIRAEHGFTRIANTTIYTNANVAIARNLTTLRGLYGGTIQTAPYFIRTGGGQYIGMAFTGAEIEQDMPGSTGATPGGQQQTDQTAAGYIYMTISRCAGDFRLRSNIGASDTYMACSSALDGAGLDNLLGFTIGNTQSTHPQLPDSCTLDRNVTYYLNVVFADPRPSAPGGPGLAPGEIDCQDKSPPCGTKFTL